MKKSQKGLKLFSQNATMQLEDEARVEKITVAAPSSAYIDASGFSIIESYSESQNGLSWKGPQKII